MKIACMIPARMGSSRISKKNIRLLGGLPLISHAIKAAVNSGCFDDIYVNSESEVLGEIADKEGVLFYKRPDYLSSDEATNDDFTEDFLKNIECDLLIQLLPTSPFIKASDIIKFVSTMVSKKFDTLVSVKNEKIECIYNNGAINFDQKRPSPPSQLLKPIKVYACGLMGWRRSNYLKNMKSYGCGYHGGSGKIGFFTLSGFSTVDIDTEQDFQLAEAVTKMKPSESPEYYKDSSIETCVPDILKKDGVASNDLFSANKEVVNIESILKDAPAGSWSKRLVDTDSNSATLICQNPGEGNRRHYHSDWNEWWYIIDGEWMWEIEGEERTIKKNDVVFIEQGKVHKITAVGNKPAIRLAVSRSDVAHIYV